MAEPQSDVAFGKVAAELAKCQATMCHAVKRPWVSHVPHVGVTRAQAWKSISASGRAKFAMSDDTVSSPDLP